MSMTHAPMANDGDHHSNQKKRFFVRRSHTDDSTVNSNDGNGLKPQLNAEQFEGKLIGHEFVAESRGERMCQESMRKLKILQRAINRHKRRVIIFISFDGIKIRDAQTSELLFHHSVPQISFISRDESDSRAFGYVFGSSITGHQFIALRTEKVALPVMTAIGQLFAAALERKRKEQTIDDVDSSEQETQSRRESSITLRPPPSPLPFTQPQGEISATIESHITANNSDELFNSMEPIDSVFESDWNVTKEHLERMNSNSGDNVDPFANSFGSMSISSGEMTNWANFDVPLANATQTQMNISAPDGDAFGGDPFASSEQNFSPISSLASIKSEPTLPMPINVPLPATGASKSVSSASSADRYACFNEISSQSSSVFDSLCDQIADEEISRDAISGLFSKSITSKSLNNSLNGGFIINKDRQKPEFNSQLSSSFNGSFRSFENPLKWNSPPFNATKRDSFDIQNAFADVFPNEPHHSPPSAVIRQQFFPLTNNSPPPSASPPPPPSSKDPFSTAFADLDPLGKDKPFVDKTSFFAEQKKKQTLRDLEYPNTCANVSDDSMPSQPLSQLPHTATISHGCSNSSLSRSSSSASSSSVAINPFHSECYVSSEQSTHPRVISPLNPFISPHSCAAYDNCLSGSSGQCPTPPPRPPPRIDRCISPAVPLSRVPMTVHERNARFNDGDNHNDGSKYTELWSESQPPPLPNPQRRTVNRKSWDPFSTDAFPPLTAPPPLPPPVPARPSKLNSLWPVPESSNPTDSAPNLNNLQTMGCHMNDFNNVESQNAILNSHGFTSNIEMRALNANLSPPERNIFIRNKSKDPFDDPFFTK